MSTVAPPPIANLLRGKKGLVIGIANDQSIAWGCAKAFHAFGAEVAVTYLNDKARAHVEPLARQIDAPLLLPLDVLQDGQIEAVFAFILGTDPTYAVIEDGQWLDDTLPYGTVHRLASAGKHKGVASAVLDWSMEHCQSLRADTHADNKIMQHLLEKNGFTRCGIIHVADGSPRFAYQKLAPTQPLG